MKFTSIFFIASAENLKDYLKDNTNERKLRKRMGKNCFFHTMSEAKLRQKQKYEVYFNIFYSEGWVS